MVKLEEISGFIDFLGDAIIIVNESSEVIFANQACKKMFGYQTQAMKGMMIEQLMKPASRKSFNHPEIVKRFIRLNLSARTMLTRSTMPCVSASGDAFNARISIASVSIDGQLYGMATIQDFTAIQKEIEHLEVSSHQDILTSLYNRRYLEKITKPNSRLLKTWKNIGVIFIDLDKFKPINDKYGHEVGDAILQVVSKRIKGCIRFDDIVFRIGGDEFLVFLNLTGIPDRLNSINHIVKNIHAEIMKPIETEHSNVMIGLSAGCGLYPEDESELMRLVNLTDKAMYSAKETSENIAFV